MPGSWATAGSPSAVAPEATSISAPDQRVDGHRPRRGVHEGGGEDELEPVAVDAQASRDARSAGVDPGHRPDRDAAQPLGEEGEPFVPRLGDELGGQPARHDQVSGPRRRLVEDEALLDPPGEHVVALDDDPVVDRHPATLDRRRCAAGDGHRVRLASDRGEGEAPGGRPRRGRAQGRREAEARGVEARAVAGPVGHDPRRPPGGRGHLPVRGRGGRAAGRGSRTGGEAAGTRSWGTA